ncbi:MAG TPA: glycoside hydrolase family 3 N-terminal domain-containing protein [Stenomitos sp.]
MTLPPFRDLPLATRIAQLFCLAIPSADPTALAEAAEDLRRHAWGGYIFDARRDDRNRLAELQAAAPLPLLVACDLEMGAGQHLDEATRFPHAMAFGATAQPEHAYHLGRLTALEARAAGINWVLAPIADVNSNPHNPIINVRSFGSDPERVAAFVAAFVRGCEEHGAIACAKHFPGHGDTADDSHSRLATSHATRDRLEHLEWVPFRAAIAAGVGSVMSAHVAVPALDPTGLPATLSSRILGTLRTELGYDGLIVSDALIMGGVTETFNDETAAVEALLAGCDVLLMPPNPQKALAAVLAAVQEGELDEERINQSVARVWALKERVLAAQAARPGDVTREAEALAEAVAREALTLAKGEPEALPVDLPRAFQLLIDDDEDPAAYAPWSQGLAARELGTPRVVTRQSNEAELHAIRPPEPGMPVICAVFSTVKAWKGRIDLSSEHAALLNRLRDEGHPLYLVSFSNPYIARQVPRTEAFLCAYSDHPASQRAALAALAGEAPVRGTLPVTLDSWPGTRVLEA